MHAHNKLYETEQKGNETTTQKYVYNGLNQLTSLQVGQGTYSAVNTWIETGSYAYDAYGNRTSETQYAYSFEAGNHELYKEIQYVYDRENRLTAMQEKAANESAFTVQSQSVYDGTGQRVRRYAGDTGTYEKHYYMGANPLLQTTQSGGNVIGENILDASGKVIASRRENAQGGGSRYWLYHYDLQGKMVSMAGVDAQGNLTYGEYNEYDPYGKPEAGSSTNVKNDVKYMGGVSDASGLYYLNARHYDANTGRFLQQDTYKGNPYAPWTQNLYAYCNNNPTSFIDPTGHAGWGSFSYEDQRMYHESKGVFRETMGYLEQLGNIDGKDHMNKFEKVNKGILDLRKIQRNTAGKTEKQVVKETAKVLNDLTDVTKREFGVWGQTTEEGTTIDGWIMGTSSTVDCLRSSGAGSFTVHSHLPLLQQQINELQTDTIHSPKDIQTFGNTSQTVEKSYATVAGRIELIDFKKAKQHGHWEKNYNALSDAVNRNAGNEWLMTKPLKDILAPKIIQ